MANKRTDESSKTIVNIMPPKQAWSLLSDKKKFKAYPIGYHESYFNFFKNRILFIEPSYIAFCDKLALIDLNRVKEEIDENDKYFTLHSILMKIEGFGLISQCQNLDRELIIYIKEDSIL